MLRQLVCTVLAMIAAAPVLADGAVTLDRHADAVNTVAYSKDGEWLASAGDDNVIILWHARSHAVKFTLKIHDSSCARRSLGKEEAMA